MGLSSCISKASDGIKKAAKKQKNTALRAGDPDTSAEFQESQLKVLAKLTAKFGDIAAIDGNKEAEVELLKSVIEDLKLDRETVAIQIEQAGLKVPAMPKLTVIEGGAGKQAEGDGYASVNADQANEPNANLERHRSAQRMYGQHRRAFLSKFSGRELREQEKFVEAAEQKFSAGRIMGFLGGKTVQATDSVVDASGSVRVFLMGPSGNFVEADTMPIEETVLYKDSAVNAGNQAGTASADPDWLNELFGESASAPAADAQPKRSMDMTWLVQTLRDFSKQKLEEANDWASRKYKQSKTQINFEGDGPTRNESMSVSAANESRRRRNIESLQQQAQAASNLANRIENGRNVQAEIEQAIRDADNDIARDGKARFGGTRETQIEAYISGSMLGDDRKAYGDGTVAHLIRKAYEQDAAVDIKAEVKTDTAKNTEDAGQELKANKRGRKAGLKWDDIKDQDAALRVSSTTKAKVLEKPDYQAMIDGGMSPYIAHIVKQAYDAIAAKPQTRTAPTDEQLQSYIDGANRYMDGVIAWANGPDAMAWLGSMGKSAASTLSAMRGERVSVTELAGALEVTQEGRKLLDVVYPNGWRNNQDEIRLIGGNKSLGALQPGLDDLRKAMKEIEKGWPEKQEAWQRQGFQIANIDQPQLIATKFYEGETSRGKSYVSVTMAYPKDRKSLTLLREVIDDAKTKDDEAVQSLVSAALEKASGKFVLFNKNGTMVSAHDTEAEAQEAARNAVKREGKENEVSEKGISVEMAGREGPARRSLLSKSLIDSSRANAKSAGDSFIGNASPSEVFRLLDIPLSAPLESSSLGVYSGVDKDVSHVASIASEFLRYLNDRGALGVESFRNLDVDRKALVLSAMFSSVQNPKVRERVVKLIPVDVMDMLSREKLSAYKLLSNPSVLSNALSLNDNPSVAVPDLVVASEFVSAVTGVIAKDVSNGAAWTLPDNSPAGGASAGNESGSSRVLMRNGHDVTSDELLETFSFSGVNFGNWLNGNSNTKERQLHLNHAYDAFLDLADILDVPPKAMSLNGMLGLAIGAQGNGKHAAHFVPGLNEINITRTAGAGALAHEWGHALDHHFARLAGLDREAEPFLTEHATMPAVMKRSEPDPENPGRLRTVSKQRFAEGLRPEILEKFKVIVQAMNKRELTPAEVEIRRSDAIANGKKRVNSWLSSIKRDFMSPTMIAVGKAVPEADFDALAERIRNLDLGDGMVRLGKTANYVSPAVDELRGLYKKATGSSYSIDSIKALQSWIDSLKYRTDNQEDASLHVPQMVTTTYASEAAKLDRDKGGKKYWSTDVEKFARAFDAFISDQLADRAARNTYLAGLNNDERTSPMGEERKTINAAFKSLVDAIETKETDSGIALYQSGVQYYYDQYQQRAAAFNDLPASQRDAESRYGFSLEGANGEPSGVSGVDGNKGADSTTGRGRYAVLGNGVAKEFAGSGNARLGDVQSGSERSVLRQSDSNIAGRDGSDGNAGRMEDGSGETGRGRYSSVAGVAEDFRATGRTKLVGLQIRSPDDLATAAQIYRDPRLETARYFFTKNGEVIGQTAISSRKPGVTKIFPGKTEQDFVRHIDDISEQMRLLGADGVWMLHNHPSGDPRPSGADIASTIRVRNEFNRRGLVFNGHVIINSQRYGFIDPNGKQRVVIKDFGAAAMYDINKPKVAHPLIGGNASTPGHLALIAKLSQKASGNVVVIGLSGGFTTRVISEVSPDQLRGKFGAAILRRIAKQTGSDRLFAYGVAPSDIGAVREAIKTGLLVDGIVVDNGVETSVAGLPNTEGPMNGYSLGTQDTGFVVEQSMSAPSVDRATIESIVIDNFRSIIENMKSAKKLTEDCK